MTVFEEASLPVLVIVTVYSRTSPGRSEPPFRSTNVLPEVVKSGLNVEMEVTNAPSA